MYISYKEMFFGRKISKILSNNKDFRLDTAS